jgi:hypothetical protein
MTARQLARQYRPDCAIAGTLTTRIGSWRSTRRPGHAIVKALSR